MPTSTTFTISSLEETIRFGQHIANLILPGDVIFLIGDLGAGKTTLTKAIGHELGIPVSCYITSPTFSLLHEYEGRIPLYHMDLYRLSGEEEIAELGFEDYIYGNGVCLIEWPERLGDLTPTNRLSIQITAKNNSRAITLSGYGSMGPRTHSFQI